MGAEQLLFDPEEAGWLVHEVDGGEVECQPVGKDLAEPVDNVQTIIILWKRVSLETKMARS